MTHRRLMLRLAPAAVAVLVAAAATVTTAEETTSVLSLTDYSAELFLEGRHYSDKTRRDDGDTRQREWWLREGVELRGQGAIYHPNLIDWRANLRLGLSHHWLSLDDQSARDTGHLLGYDLSALVLQDKPVSGRLFGTLHSEVIGRSFAGPLEIDRRSEGLEAYYRGPLHASLLLRHQVSTEESPFRIQDSESWLTRLSFTDNQHRGRYHKLVYEYEDLERTLRFTPRGTGSTTVQDRDMTRHELQLTNRWTFGERPLQHRISGRTQLLNRQGFFARDRVSVRQRLDLSHTPSFSSFYGGSFVWDDTDFQTQRSIAGEMGVTKRIYDSLRLTPRVDVSDQRFDDGHRRSLGVFLDADYRKVTPIGQLRSRLHVGRRVEEEAADGALRNVSNESVTLAGITFRELGQRHVVAGSVFVTDATNTITYFEGTDYELRTSGAFTEIRRIATGDIDDGETVLVSYIASTARDVRFDTDVLRWRIRFRFDDIPLAVYFEYALRDESLRSGNQAWEPERDERILVGSDVFLGDLTITPEYEWRSFRLSPSWNAYRVRATYMRPISRDFHFNSSAHYEMLTYRDAERFGLEPGRDFLESYGAQARVTGKVRRDTVVRFDASYLKTRGRNNDELIRFGPSLTWSRGAMDLTVSGYQTFYQQEHRRGRSTFARFDLRRQF